MQSMRTPHADAACGALLHSGSGVSGCRVCGGRCARSGEARRVTLRPGRQQCMQLWCEAAQLGRMMLC